MKLELFFFQSETDFFFKVKLGQTLEVSLDKKKRFFRFHFERKPKKIISLSLSPFHMFDMYKL